jgi:hypothetical protein
METTRNNLIKGQELSVLFPKDKHRGKLSHLPPEILLLFLKLKKI